MTTTAWGTHRVLNAMSPRPLPRSFIDRIMRYSDWGHKRAVLKLYRASRHVGKSIPAMPEYARTLPVCVIWGAGDPFIKVGFAEKQKRYFPLAEVHVLQGLGHWPFVDDVGAVRGLLVEFLKRQVGRD